MFAFSNFKFLLFKLTDTLVLFANGNNGSSGYNSVAPPATCKDCLSVGASLNDRESFLGYTAGEYLLVFIFHYKKILLSTMGA